jgi:hypothetical protein
LAAGGLGMGARELTVEGVAGADAPGV